MPRTWAARAGWALLDGWTIAERDIRHWLRQPFNLLVGLVFPVIIALMMGYVFGGAMSLPGGGEYFAYLMPGIFAQTMLFGVMETFTHVTTDAQRGVTDRFRSLPISSGAVVLGRGIADMLNSTVGLTLMLGCGLLVGWRWQQGIGNALLAIGLLLLLRFAFLWLGIYLALVLKRPEAIMTFQILIWPLAFLSSVYAPPETMPAVLGGIVEWNPISATVTATRALFGNPGGAAVSWATANALPLALGWPLLILAIFAPLAVRRYRRLNV
ncbi:MAG: ABC transporter permease [Chloroflexi bacterium]|nr:ABC transporter permease [Chloroflexota bacterium]